MSIVQRASTYKSSNWRDLSQYPDATCSPKGLYSWAWAWEYLRRHPIYQENYDRLIGEWPELSSSEDIAQWSKKIHNKELRKEWKYHFGISTLTDYRSDIPPCFVTTEIMHPHVALQEMVVESTLYQGDMLARINLNAPLKPQMNELHKELKRYQDEAKKLKQISETRNANARSHIKYLRLLDAEKEGVSVTEYREIIGQKEYKNKDDVEYNLGRAKMYLNGGYKIIAAYSAGNKQIGFKKKSE